MSGKTETLSVKAEFVRTGWQGCVRVEYTSCENRLAGLCESRVYHYKPV